ncbi:HAD family hydrolase, partial [Enterococcus faecalis]
NWEQDFAPESKIKAEIQRLLKITETNEKDE